MAAAQIVTLGFGPGATGSALIVTLGFLDSGYVAPIPVPIVALTVRHRGLTLAGTSRDTTLRARPRDLSLTVGDR